MCNRCNFFPLSLWLGVLPRKRKTESGDSPNTLENGTRLDLNYTSLVLMTTPKDMV